MYRIGLLSLNISLVIYIIWLIPQLWHNFKHKKTQFNYWMHYLLVLGYLMDLLYGFGLHMQWQYRLVTLCGLINLSIQHIQIFLYGLQSKLERQRFWQVSSVFLLLVIGIITLLTLDPTSKEIYHLAGMTAVACWLSFSLPQIISNYKNKASQGLNPSFILLTLLLCLLDGLSAWGLNWEYPSKIGQGIRSVEALILIFQLLYFSSKQRLLHAKL